MKLAITVGTDDAHPQALVVFRGLEQSLPRIKALGYDGIELALFQAESLDMLRLRALLRDNGLELPVISTGQISRVMGVHFTDPDPQNRNRAVALFSSIINVGAEFGADINVSLVRGRVPPGASRADAEEWLADCLVRLCRQAEKAGIALLLEQMNRYETDLLNSIPEVAEFIGRVGMPNLKIHADTFHMNIEDVDMPRTLQRHIDKLGYLHLSDSNRLWPGAGHIDFDSILTALREAGYTRWLGVEVLRVPDSVGAAERSIAHVLEIQKRLGLE